MNRNIPAVVPYGRHLADPRGRADLYGYAYDYPGEEPEESAIDLRAIWLALYRNRLLIGAVMIVSLLLGVVSILLSAPTYRAQATIQIEQQARKVLGTEDDVEPAASGAEVGRFLQTQVDVLKSRALADQVASELRLSGNDRFLESVDRAVPPDASPKPDAKAMRERVLGALRGNLDVSLPPTSRVVEISFESRDPEISALVANAFATNFIESNLQRRFDASSYSRDFLQGQLAQAKTRLEASERAMIAYARGARLIDTGSDDSTGSRSLTTSNLVHLNQAYADARSKRVQAQQRWQQAQSTPLMSLPEVLANSTVQQLTQKRAELQAQHEQELQRRQPDHPAVMQAAAQLRELDRQIDTVATSIRNSIRDQHLVAMRQEQALRGNVGQLTGETLAEQDRGVRYNILKREADTNRELYDGLLQRYKELTAAAGITTNNISIVDKAEPPLSPISPRPMLNMALAAMAGLGLALVLVFAREYFDDAVRAPEDVDRKLGLPLFGVIPLLKPGASPIVELSNPRSPISEAYHTVRASIELSSGEGVPKSLLITSTREAEGKSTAALAIARDFAVSGKRVLLIDADLRCPSLHRSVGSSNIAGLSHILAQQRTLDEVVIPTDIPTLDFVASGPLPPNPAELLSRTTLAVLLESLQERYDNIIIDGPPVLGLADALRIGAVVRGTLFVIEANRAHRGHTKAALRRLFSARIQPLGAVLSKFDARKMGYGSAYGTSYYGYGATEELDHSIQSPLLDRPPAAAPPGEPVTA